MVAGCAAHPRCVALWFLSLIALHNPVITGSIPAREHVQASLRCIAHIQWPELTINDMALGIEVINAGQ